MSKIDELIKELCPNGVEYKTLSEIAEYRSSGVDKKKSDKDNPILLLNFTDVFHNMYLYKTTPTMEVTATDREIKECDIKLGDIFITPSSEVKNEIGVAAVVKEDMPGAVYSYHISRVRIFNQDDIMPEFIRYVFGSVNVQIQINKMAEGITRFGLTKPKWERLSFPIPPIEVQEEIVNILDKFVKLEAELEAELEVRKIQYEFYRGNLFDIKDSSELKTLDDVSDIYDSLHQTPSYTDEGYAMIRVADVKSGYVDLDTALKVSEDSLKIFTKKYKPTVDDIVISRVGSYGNVALIPNADVCLGQNTAIIHPKINNKYLYHFLSSSYAKQYIERNTNGAGYKNLSLKSIRDIPVLVPSLEAQERIANILDKFDKLINDITEGLPAEIQMRRQQYEYYRDKLLSFEKVGI